MADSLSESRRLFEIFDDLDIPYAIGGSVASSTWGMPRQTNDIDVEIWISTEQVRPLTARLSDYYFSEIEIERAVTSGDPYACFQLIHQEEGLQFDVFVQADLPFTRECLARRVEKEIDGFVFRFESAEEIVIQKLRWYALGGRVSERQWRDLRAILSVNPRLDWIWIDKWAEQFELVDDYRGLREECM